MVDFYALLAIMAAEWRDANPGEYEPQGYYADSQDKEIIDSMSNSEFMESFVNAVNTLENKND